MASVQMLALIPVVAEHADAARAIVKRLEKESQNEEGNLRFAACESAAAPGTFVVVEDWSTQAALDDHLRAPHLATAMEQLTPLLAGTVAVHPLVPLA